MVRIALLGISHETNTYCTDMTPLDAFHVRRGMKMVEARGQESDVGGAVDACYAMDCEPVPILFAGTQPSGTIERSAYDDLKEEILAGLADVGDVDACVLLLHGAGVVDGIEDLEGDLAASVREALGDKPITASFDLHGNVTQFMADQLNGVFACHHYPHIDMHQRAAEAVALAKDMAQQNYRCSCQVIRLPMLLPTTTTYEGIGKEFLQRLIELEEASECIDISWFHGFPYTDIEHVGSFVVVTHRDGDQEGDHAEKFATELWSRREEFRPLSLSGDEAIDAAAEFDDGPVVIHETSDNCGAGTPGDGTHLLRAMLARGLGRDACFAFIVDPTVARQAHEAGVGATLNVEIGGRSDELHGAPLVASVYVKAIHDGRLIMQHMFKGAPLNIGPMARLVIEEMDVVVASRRSQTFDLEPFLAVGIDVMKYKYVALKSSNHFRACFQDLAAHIVTADTPGLSTHQIEVFPRQRTVRKLWPLDPQTVFPEPE